MRRRWTEAEIAWLKENYLRKDIFVKDMAAFLDRPIHSVHTKARMLGLKRPAEIYTIGGQKGRTSPGSIAHRFQKGHVPANMGKKMPAEVYAKVAKTMFKKGNRPKNTAAVGDEAVRKGGYIYVKIAEPNRWKAKHHILWESANGKIPRGYNVQFRNKDVTDIRLENLYLISRKEQLLTENSLCARYPEDIQKVIRLRGSIKRSITMYNRKQEKEDV